MIHIATAAVFAGVQRQRPARQVQAQRSNLGDFYSKAVHKLSRQQLQPFQPDQTAACATTAAADESA